MNGLEFPHSNKVIGVHFYCVVSVFYPDDKPSHLFLQVQKSKKEVEEKLSALDKENLKLRMEREENMLLVTERDRQVSMIFLLYFHFSRCVLVSMYL